MKAEYLPQIVLPTPALTLLVDAQGRVWAGGMGGIAVYDKGTWRPRSAGLPLTGVAALAAQDGWLWAGGAEGIARSADGGQSWQTGVTHGVAASVTTLAVSPTFAEDTSLLAATLSGGVLRSEDAGASWTAANFGLGDVEVTALLWPQREVVLAATASGIYRSPNGGRAWRAAGAAGQPVAALAQTSDGHLLAALEGGGLLVSADGASWSALATDLPTGIEPAALCLLTDGTLLLAALEGGLFRSVDGGLRWQRRDARGMFALAQAGGRVYAGSGTDVLVSEDGGGRFAVLPRLPMHDLRHLVAAGDRLLVYGRFSGALVYDGDVWRPLTALIPPLGLLCAAPDGTLYASTLDGLHRCQPGGEWETLIKGPGGCFARFIIDADGGGWACSHDYRYLLRTPDGGIHWQVSASPFGVLPLVALEAVPGLLFGATFDARQQRARLWRSHDGGVRWEPGAEAHLPWPLVATWHDPPLIALGGLLMVNQGSDMWARAQVNGMTDFMTRQIVGSGGTLLALTTRGLLQSVDGGLNWSPLVGLDVPVDEMMSITLIQDTAYLLLAGGQVVGFNVQ